MYCTIECCSFFILLCILNSTKNTIIIHCEGVLFKSSSNYQLQNWDQTLVQGLESKSNKQVHAGKTFDLRDIQDIQIQSFSWLSLYFIKQDVHLLYLLYLFSFFGNNFKYFQDLQFLGIHTILKITSYLLFLETYLPANRRVNMNSMQIVLIRLVENLVHHKFLCSLHKFSAQTNQSSAKSVMVFAL